ncbi:AfsR/SARP family transcriptional regulator [Pseudoprimorskyibacter insulae]|uniref:AfsR/SARP family transcriptional regulator n=1 Tax=Pseudoprimorskyibacter insulae TaxID=1695997 RepID=UPI0011B1D560|nr:BTAD domain-containing putative transcriptional regulator [Pseudoprimorskyibacter insulae]
MFDDSNVLGFLEDALTCVPSHGRPVIVVSNEPTFARRILPTLRLTLGDLGLDGRSLEPEEFATLLRPHLARIGAAGTLLVDMRWLMNMVQGNGNIRTWGQMAESLAKDMGLTVISRYDRELLIEEQVQAAFRAHRQFLARSGLYDNPYWIPDDLRLAPWGEQMSFLLGRVVPDYANVSFFMRDDRFAAHGADPEWVAKPRGMTIGQRKSDVWQIYCFGQLRVYRNGRERIEWKLKGGAPKKTRTLFAYLLTCGEKGAHADRIAELLWPDDTIEDGKRARLHHTIAMLRKTLGHGDSVLRSGDFYRLNPPEGSWIDITSFEQLCRRGLSLVKRGQRKEALQIYHTAERLYAGDLFEDIPLEYVESDQEDWCLPRRVWLREMAIKLQRDMSVLLREDGNLREALDHCTKALALDPTSESANIEAMRVFHAQGRPDTVARQYRQYRKAVEAMDASPEGSEVQALFRALTRV